MKNEYRISELAAKASVTKRTIHYYISKGLIPPPMGAGLGTTYDDEHLARIKLIKHLQDKYLPLEKIKDMLSGMTYQEVLHMLEDDIKEESVFFQPQIKSKSSVAKTSVIKEYCRLELGKGIELHFPKEIIEDYADTITNIKKYAQRLLEEK